MIHQICKLEYTSYFHLRNCVVFDKYIFIHQPIYWEKIEVIGNINVECNAEQTPSGVIYTTKANANIKCLPLTNMPLVFRLTDIYGNCYIIGNGERPHPIHLCNLKMGKPSETTGGAFMINWVSHYPLLIEKNVF